MASPTVAHQNHRHQPARSDLELNNTKLQSAVEAGQGEIYILQWLTKAEEAIEKLPAETLLEVQSKLEETLVYLVCPLELDAVGDASSGSASSVSERHGVPTLGRPARHIIARCLVTLFARAETRSLYELMQSLMRIAGEETRGRPIPEKESKAGSIYIAGEVFLAAGHNVMSQFVALLTLCQRLTRNTNLAILVRYHALVCLTKVLRNGGKSLNDQMYKDINRTLRYGINDSAGAIARASADAYVALLENTIHTASLADIDSLLLSIFKSQESADFPTTRALSRLAAHLLALTQRENTAPRPPRPRRKKSSKADDKDASSDDESGPSSVSVQAAGGHTSMLTPKAMLERISAAALRTSTTKRGRGSLLNVYAKVLELQGPVWVQGNYNIIIQHLVDDLPNALANTLSRADSMSMRTGINMILRDVVGERMLDEAAQVGALEELSTTFLKRWPILTPGQQPPSKVSLVIAFNEVTGLLHQLGSAPPQVVDALNDPIVRCLSHPSHSVQVSAAWCLRTLCLVNPLLLRPSMEIVRTNLDRDLKSLQGSGERGGADIPKRAVGHARGLGSLISVIFLRPLYISFDITGGIFDLALKLLKDSAEHSLAISAVEIQVSWTLLGALMSLGPEFIKNHMTRLLNMWRSALPRLSETNATRSEAEWSFLLHARECTLGSVYSFLHFTSSSSILTLDIARRIIALLSHALAFANTFSEQHPTLAQDHVPGTERGGSLSLLDRELLVRRRVFQCFAILATNPALEVMQEALVGACVQTFADPDRHIGSTAQAAIAASAGNFVSVWQLSDGYACGTTSMLQDQLCSVALTSAAERASQGNDYLNRDVIEARLHSLQRRPIPGGPEFDPLVLYMSLDSSEFPTPSPPATGVIDAAIEVFAKLMPFQKRDTQIGAMESILTHIKSPKLDKNPGRRMAIQANACAASLGLLRTAMQPVNGARVPAGFRNERLAIATRTLLLDFLTQGEQPLRIAASEAYGRLAALAGSQTMASQVQILVDQVVSNRSPHVRAGCAAAFGAIYNEVGGLATGPLIKTVVDILLSLSNDPHPMVHYSSLRALRLVISAASLSYSPYVQSTLGMLVKLCMSTTHEAEGGSAGSVNLRADLPANQALCQIVHALIGVIGPDLQDSVKIRSLIVILLEEFSREDDDAILVEATKAKQNFALFAAQYIDLVAWMKTLQRQLKLSSQPLKVASINAFYQLVQRNALLVSKTCGNSLVEDFYSLLDGDADTDGIKQVLLSWLRQTAHLSPTSWIELCQRVSRNAPSQVGSKAGKVKPAQPQAGVLQDEEAAAIDLGDDSNEKVARFSSRWRTQLFALQCLHEVLSTVHRAGKVEQFSTPVQQSQLSSRVADLIKMAFTASTSVNLEIRLEGLTILNDVIEFFKDARDPDFEDALLLEQHQAPIAAALTPAFLSDSIPEVIAKAVQVCAVFVGCGVVCEVDKLGRILKLLTRALESCREPDMSRLGEVKNLSSNASMILRIAVYKAWAQLQVASVRQQYITKVLEPYVAQLSSAWVDTLAEYSHLRADPEGVGMGVAAIVSPMLDSPYSGLVRTVLLPHHQRSWPVILDAVASLMSSDSPAIYSAMEGDNKEGASSFRSEPALHFFPLYGLSFEALATATGSHSEIETIRKTLLALRFLCRPQFAGGALLEDQLFDELIELCYRIIVTEGASVQIATVRLVASIASSYRDRLLSQDHRKEDPSSAVSTVAPSKLTTCLRLTLFTISFARTNQAALASSSEERANLIMAAFNAYLQVSTQYNSKQRLQLYAVAFKAYSDLLNDETSDADLVGTTLTSLKELCRASTEVFDESLGRSIHGFLSDCLNTLDNVRSRSGAAVLTKTKNALLSMVVMITTLPTSIPLSQHLLESFCYELSVRLRKPQGEDGLQIALTSLNCVKTVLLAATRGPSGGNNSTIGSTLAFCIGHILTNLTQVLVSIRRRLAAADENSMRVAEESLKTLTGFASIGADEAYRARVIGIIVPTLALFLQVSNDEPDDKDNKKRTAGVQNTSVHQILAIARQYPVAFRAVLALQDSDTRTIVESSVKAAFGVGNTAQASTRGYNASPSQRAEVNTIELKSFG